jgi:hypothetical protein
LIFDFLFISNRDTCDDSITQDFKDGKLPPKTKVKHIIVREYLGYKNRRHDKQHYNQQDKFMWSEFGDSTTVRKALIDSTLGSILQQELRRYPNVVFVGQGIYNEENTMTSNNYHAWDGYLRSPPALDTQALFRFANDCTINTNSPGMIPLLNEIFGLSDADLADLHLHNAANDAVWILMLLLYKIQRYLRQDGRPSIKNGKEEMKTTSNPVPKKISFVSCRCSVRC